MKKGFTLIELLVVVLIIGILAAVALPQYTKAVEKSRATEAVAFLSDLATAERIHQMATGDFAVGTIATINPALDLEMPESLKSYTIGTSAKTGDDFTISLERANGASTYFINMRLPKEPGAPTIWCSVATATDLPTSATTLADSTAGNMCRSIANGQATGLISGPLGTAS